MIACDLGSNTLRIVEIDCESGRRIHEFERMVKTADGLHTTGLINDKAIERIISAINEAKKIFDLRDAHAVTTAAVRMAKNGQEVLKKIKEKTGLEFIMIEATKEALLTSLAVQWRLRKLGYHDKHILMDLGGGSTEISLAGESQSFNVGIVTMAQKYGSAEGVIENLDHELSALTTYIKSFEIPSLFVATAGTPTTIAAFKQGLDYAHYDVEKVNGTILSLEDLEVALEKLLYMNMKERERWVGVGRDDLIVAGVLIVKSIMIAAGFSTMLVIDDGLREGVALEKCQEKLSFSA
ncbi:MAG TPA: phosphatase [Campylobacterales bacterium]|nr:phosphatase [Campylobacterales bacterium]